LEKKKFRVIIAIPLVPGFPGVIGKSQSKKTILKYTYRSISRNRGLSIMEYLYALMGDKVSEYITFLSLRNHALLGDTPKSEIIYIHSKVMLVDDEISIVGSANINDRSLLGSRDSEVCAVVRDRDKTDQVQSVIDGKVQFVSKFTRDFRIRLMKVRLISYSATPGIQSL
jgi:phospholipase D1/2